MANDTDYVLAPFVFLEGNFYKRLDHYASGAPMRFGLRKSPVVEEIFQFFTNPNTITNYLRECKLGSPSDLNRLIDARFIVLKPIGRELKISLELEVTNNCNAACVMCPRDFSRPRGFLETRRLPVLKELVSSSVGMIIQGMGEPTIHPEIVDIVAYLKSLLSSESPLVLVTNGIKMTGDLFQRLIVAGVDMVQWSLHATSQSIFEEIMKSKRFDVVIANLRECSTIDASRLSINFVETKFNASELPRVRALVEGIGISGERVGVIPVFSRGGTIDSNLLSGGIARKGRGRCLAVRKGIYVAWNGDVMPCSNDVNGTLIFGNAFSQSAEEVKRIWQTQFLAKPLEYEICRSCDHFLRETQETAWFEQLIKYGTPNE